MRKFNLTKEEIEQNMFESIPELKNTFVIRTDDDEFKSELYKFLYKHTQEKKANVGVYELEKEIADQVMRLIKQT